MERLYKWRVSKDETEMTGAAAVLLSISDLGLILHSPLWCSALTSRKIARYQPSWNQRLYSTFVEEEDLVFGSKKKLEAALQKIKQNDPCSLIGVAVNCAPALVGDDIEGICNSVIHRPVVVVDAGGFSGEADQGWSDGMLGLLKKVSSFSDKRYVDTINLIGGAIYDASSQGRIAQQKIKNPDMQCRIPGYEEMRFAELSRLSEASLNIVLHPRGLEIARWMKNNCDQPYVSVY